jgi:hypothetical protein
MLLLLGVRDQVVGAQRWRDRARLVRRSWWGRQRLWGHPPERLLNLRGLQALLLQEGALCGLCRAPHLRAWRQPAVADVADLSCSGRA